MPKRRIDPKKLRNGISHAINNFRMHGVTPTDIYVNPKIREKLTPYLLDGCVLGVPVMASDDCKGYEFHVVSDPPPGYSGGELTQDDANRFAEWANTFINERSDN